MFSTGPFPLSSFSSFLFFFNFSDSIRQTHPPPFFSLCSNDFLMVPIPLSLVFLDCSTCVWRRNIESGNIPRSLRHLSIYASAGISHLPAPFTWIPEGIESVQLRNFIYPSARLFLENAPKSLQKLTCRNMSCLPMATLDSIIEFPCISSVKSLTIEANIAELYRVVRINLSGYPLLKTLAVQVSPWAPSNVSIDTIISHFPPGATDFSFAGGTLTIIEPTPMIQSIEVKGSIEFIAGGLPNLISAHINSSAAVAHMPSSLRSLKITLFKEERILPSEALPRGLRVLDLSISETGLDDYDNMPPNLEVLHMPPFGYRSLCNLPKTIRELVLPLESTTNVLEIEHLDHLTKLVAPCSSSYLRALPKSLTFIQMQGDPSKETLRSLTSNLRTLTLTGRKTFTKANQLPAGMRVLPRNTNWSTTQDNNQETFIRSCLPKPIDVHLRPVDLSEKPDYVTVRSAKDSLKRARLDSGEHKCDLLINKRTKKYLRFLFHFFVPLRISFFSCDQNIQVD